MSKPPSVTEQAPTTIYDIAKLAEASPATVSRVLSNSSYHVSDGLRERILKAARELNYIPNGTGRQLKTKVSRTIGVMIPSVSNPYYASVVSGIEEIAFEKGYNVLLCNSRQNAAEEAKYLHMMFEQQVAGLIISPLPGNHDIIGRFIGRGLNVVAFDQTLECDGVCQIDFDYRKGGYLATRHLVECGHTSIAYLTAPLDRGSRKLIYEGYRQALTEAGISPDEQTMMISDTSGLPGEMSEFAAGRELGLTLLAQPKRPTAAFICNDMTAFGVLHVLSEHGVKVPVDISLIGFDNIKFGEMVSPSLTTIEQPKYELGKLACTLLLRNEGAGRERGVMLEPQLVRRASVQRM